MSATTAVSDGAVRAATREFRPMGEGRYLLSLLEAGLEIEIDRLRRDRHELLGELAVRCDLAGARTFEGTLSIGDFNLSSIRARQDRARYLADRARVDAALFADLLEEFSQRVLAAERAGRPSVLLRDMARPDAGENLEVDGVQLLMRHPVIVFGDGGSGKSLLAMYLAGQLARRGLRVLYADSEFAGEDHRDRLERLFGPDMPDVRYVRCERPLAAEADRLRRVVRDDAIDYLVHDSISFGCDGPPEAAEVAAAYFRAVRTIGVGSLHIAHTNRSENASDRPFGSTFWHNGARATWFLKQSEETAPEVLAISLVQKKANIGARRPEVGFEVRFEDDRTRFRRVDVASLADLAEQLPVWKRMRKALQHGPKTLATLSDELSVKVDTLDRMVRRKNGLFTRVEGSDNISRIAILERGAA